MNQILPQLRINHRVQTRAGEADSLHVRQANSFVSPMSGMLTHLI